MKQEINFRKTTGYRSDDSADAYVQISTTANYPTVTAQGNTVGWEAMGGSPFLGDLSLTLDVRLAGAIGNQDTTEGKYRIDLPSAGNYRVRCAAGVDGPRGADVRVFDGASLLSTLVSPQLTTGGFRYVDATDVERSGADWPSLNQPKDLTFTSTTLRVYNGGFDVPGTIYTYIAHFSVETLPSGLSPAFLRNHYMNQGWA